MPPPNPPTSVTANPELTGCAATVTWKAPAGDVTSYEVVAQPTQTLHAAAKSPITISELEAGAIYSFDVTAVNKKGKSTPASTAPITIAGRAASVWWSIAS